MRSLAEVRGRRGIRIPGVFEGLYDLYLGGRNIRPDSAYVAQSGNGHCGIGAQMAILKIPLAFANLQF